MIGGGNIVRGSQLSKMGMDRVSADYMGMLGTVINALALQDVLEREGHRDARDDRHPHGGARGAVHPPPRDAPPREGAHVIFAAGTGNPYFSTDTAAVLRGIQMKADVIIKATSVDGVYSADPKKARTRRSTTRSATAT